MTGNIVIGLIADIHNGTIEGPKRGDQAIELLRKALVDFTSSGVDLVIDFGDRINNGDRESERTWLQDVGDVFRAYQGRRIHLMGNHDILGLNVGDHEEALGEPCISNVVELNGFKILQWIPDVSIGSKGFEITGDDLIWLRTSLERVDCPAILVSHIPISEASMVGNYYFQQFSGGAGNYSNAAAARDLIETNPWVALCVSGHVHWNSIHTVGGVRHLTVQSLTESFTTGGEAAGAYGFLSVSPGSVDLEVCGKDPFRLSVPATFPRRPWPVPLDNYHATQT
ncbi:MAG: metallophosphoesterase family protein [Spirochaetaceae bacterium]